MSGARKPVSAMEKALRLLSRSALTEAELTAKLGRAGYPEAETAAVIADCRKRGFLNDAMLADDCAALLLSRGIGSRLAREKLRRRGLSAELVGAALDAADPQEELEAGRRALETKLRLLSRENDPRKKKEKAFRFMVSRGYTAAVIRQLFAGIDWHTPETDYESF